MKSSVKKNNSIDETIIKNFGNTNLNNITNGFATKFKENVNNVLHICDIKTINSIGTIAQNSLYLEYTNEEEIFNILKTLNSRKSAGIDGIRPMDLKIKKII